MIPDGNINLQKQWREPDVVTGFLGIFLIFKYLKKLKDNWLFKQNNSNVVGE